MFQMEASTRLEAEYQDSSVGRIPALAADLERVMKVRIGHNQKLTEPTGEAEGPAAARHRRRRLAGEEKERGSLDWGSLMFHRGLESHVIDSNADKSRADLIIHKFVC